jgi:alpha-galactosidase
MDFIPVHFSKHEEGVCKFVHFSVASLSKYCSKKYAKRIMSAQQAGALYGVYLTPSGKIRATFI